MLGGQKCALAGARYSRWGQLPWAPDALSGRFLQTADNLDLLPASTGEIERKKLLFSSHSRAAEQPNQHWLRSEPELSARESWRPALLWCLFLKEFLIFFPHSASNLPYASLAN